MRSPVDYLRHARKALHEDSFKRLNINPCSRNWLDTCSLPTHQRQERFWPIHSITLFEKREPKSILSPPQTAFEWCKKWRNNPTFVIKLPHCRFLSKDATVITHDGWILGDLSQPYPFNKPFDQNRVARQRLFPKRTHFKGTGLLLSALFGSSNYYHWMFDVTPRLRLFDLTGESRSQLDHFFVNSHAQSFQKEVLQFAGVPADKIVETDPLEYLSCDELYVPSLPNRIGFPRRWMTEYLDGLVPATSSAETPERIFIDRRDVSARHVVNNDEFCRFLEKLGFTLIIPSQLSMVETANVFRRARQIVAIHGAALSNLAFCRPGTGLLELFPCNFDNNSFWTLSCERGVDYSFWRSTETRGDENIVFDPHTLGAAIEKWAAASS